jgi:hypothetical protein
MHAMKTPLQLYVTPDLASAIKRGATKAGTTMSEFIRQAVKEKIASSKAKTKN